MKARKFGLTPADNLAHRLLQWDRAGEGAEMGATGAASTVPGRFNETAPVKPRK